MKMTTKLKTQEKHKMSEIDDHILKYFDVKKRLGKGAYGIVWKAVDKKTNQILAVKKIFDAFRDETDAQRTFREIMFLRAFRHHPNVIQLNNVYRATNNLDIYLSFEFMESDLHNVIKKGNILKDVHKRYIMYQLLNAVKYIHSGNVIHRDLKPSNVLIDTKCRCKLADFGLARSVSNQQIRDSSDSNESLEPVLTDYVATRWYRAPEILVASKRYTKGIDMWSLGCILGEMIRGKPIFQGSSTVNQIEKIVSALPEITEQDIIAVGGGFGTALLNKQISNNSAITLDELLIDGTSDANNLVKRLLILDPLARLTATEALNHRYVERFRNTIEETELNVDVQPPFRDDVRLSVTEYRSKLYEIVQQTEKSNLEKPSAYNRKREPKTSIKSVDSNPSKLNVAEHKPKRSIYRSQERKSNIPNHDAITAQKVTVNSRNNKIHIITPPTASSGTIPKPQNIVNNANPDQNQSRNGAKIQTMLSKTRLIIKPTIRHVQNLVTKNTITTPEIQSMLQTTSSCNKTVVDKRHSVDGSCGYPMTSGIRNGQTTQHLEKDRYPNQLNNSYSLRNNNVPPRVRRSSQTLCYPIQKQDRSSSELTTNGMKRTDTESLEECPDTNDGCNYYEKRLKNLEQQIEKHKRDVKAFCSENIRYSKSRGLNRSTDLLSEQDVSYKNMYSMMSAGGGKTLQLRSKTSSNCCENPIKHDMNNDFPYPYRAGDNIDNLQGIPSRYYNTSRKHS